MKETKCANLHAVNDLRYESIDLKVPKDDEVLVAVKSCGVCGSDISRVYKKGTYHFPTVIGHEFSGVVVYDARNDLTNKNVVIFPLIPCFECESCMEQNYATCANYDYYGSRCDGGMTEYLSVKRWNIIEMPENLSFDEGAMCEPVSVARHAVSKLSINKGDNVFISGAGPIGIIAGQWAKMFGANEIYYVDIDKKKIEFAKTLGFKEYDNNVVIDCVIEGTGHSDALKTCLEAIKPYGRVVFMGNPAGDITMTQSTYWHILRKEIVIRGTWNSSFSEIQNDWRESLLAMSEGKVDVKPLITHKFPLKECNKAFEMMNNRTEFYNKVILNMNEEDVVDD